MSEIGFKRLNDLKQSLDKHEVSPSQALDLLFDIYIIETTKLSSMGFTLRSLDYGFWILEEGKDYCFEGTYLECSERFYEICNK